MYPGTHHVRDTNPVCFGLVAATEACECRTGSHVDRGTCECAIADSGEYAHRRYTDIRAVRITNSLHGVSFGYVRNLMAEHSCHLAHGSGPFDQAAIHVDIPTRHRKGVYRCIVHHVKLPVQVAIVRHIRDLVAERVDVS